MAISLKNIEDRVKVLEAGGSGSKFKVLWSGSRGTTGTITLTEPMSNFDLVIIEYYSPQYIARDFIIPSLSNKNSSGTYNIAHTPGKCATSITANSMTSTTVQIVSAQSSIFKIIGLKLYYNFSYNIIYKILSSIKFKISQIISSPKIKKRR